MSRSLKSFNTTFCLIGCLLAGHVMVSGGDAFAQSGGRSAGSSSRGSRPAPRQQAGSSTRGTANGSSYRGRGGSDTKQALLETRGFALVELFTSEGYRSSSRAQQQVDWVERTGTSRDLPVYTLAFHVDRLDTDEFQDPYSSREATDRQDTYAKAYSKGSVAAPLTVINGEAKLPGSRNTAKDYINAALGSNPTSGGSEIRATAEYSQSSVEVNCQLTDWKPDDRLNVALVQKEATHEIANGKVAGQSVTQSNVVRDYKVIDGPDSVGLITATLTLPEGTNAEEFHIVVYAQSSTTGHIRSASVTALQKATAEEETEPVASVEQPS